MKQEWKAKLREAGLGSNVGLKMDSFKALPPPDLETVYESRDLQRLLWDTQTDNEVNHRSDTPKAPCSIRFSRVPATHLRYYISPFRTGPHCVEALIPLNLMHVAIYSSLATPSLHTLTDTATRQLATRLMVHGVLAPARGLDNGPAKD